MVEREVVAKVKWTAAVEAEVMVDLVPLVLVEVLVGGREAAMARWKAAARAAEMAGLAGTAGTALRVEATGIRVLVGVCIHRIAAGTQRRPLVRMQQLHPCLSLSVATQCVCYSSHR